MSIKGQLVVLMSALVVSSPMALAKDVKEPAAPGTGIVGENVKATLEKDLLDDGVQKFDANKWGEALKSLDKVVGLNAKNMKAVFYRGRTHKKLGNKAKAETDFKTVTSMKPTTADEYDMRAKAYQHIGEKTKADADFAKAKELTDKAG